MYTVLEYRCPTSALGVLANLKLLAMERKSDLRAWGLGIAGLHGRQAESLG